jgi:hypothetical protein
MQQSSPYQANTEESWPLWNPSLPWLQILLLLLENLKAYRNHYKEELKISLIQYWSADCAPFAALRLWKWYYISRVKFFIRWWWPIPKSLRILSSKLPITAGSDGTRTPFSTEHRRKRRWQWLDLGMWQSENGPLSVLIQWTNQICTWRIFLVLPLTISLNSGHTFSGLRYRYTKCFLEISHYFAWFGSH